MTRLRTVCSQSKQRIVCPFYEIVPRHNYAVSISETGIPDLMKHCKSPGFLFDNLKRFGYIAVIWYTRARPCRLFAYNMQ